MTHSPPPPPRYGHVETVRQIADHLSQIREIQIRSKTEFNTGFSEFVPLSFVAKESPMWKRQNEKNEKNDMKKTNLSLGNIDDIDHLEKNGKVTDFGTVDSGIEVPGPVQVPWIRSGPTGVEVVLAHAVSRLMLAGHIDNIQVRHTTATLFVTLILTLIMTLTMTLIMTL